MNKKNFKKGIRLVLAILMLTWQNAPIAQAAMNMPGNSKKPNYFGPEANWAWSPKPQVDPVTGQVIPGTGIRKFVDSLAGLGAANANNLGQYIPIAKADITTYQNPPSDYYEIALVEYGEQMHSDLVNVDMMTGQRTPAKTKMRGYVQLETAVNSGTSRHIALNYSDGTPILNVAGQQVYAYDNPHYLGPLIIAQRNRPVRIKFTNYLPKGAGGDLFIPVDTSVMGAGMGPKPMLDANGMPMLNPDGTPMMEDYTQNRATLHLHGGETPWISDGTPHQWTTPAGENTQYPKGVSVVDVPDMPEAEDGSLTFFYTNQQSARLMFYHDHAYGITRLNVYAGEAAGYLITETAEESLINSGAIPDQGDAQGVYRYGIPLVIQDKTFVDAATVMNTDPAWNWGSMPGMPMAGDLWFPHVYMPNQNPNDITGVNPFGRFDYSPWIWPPVNPAIGPVTDPMTGMQIPGYPDVSMVMEAMMDTPVINGTAYPYLVVEPRAYRFRILNACNDRFLNLQLYYADPANPTEIKMVRSDGLTYTGPYGPYTVEFDGRDGGVPDPTMAGPMMVQIGTEGGFLPAPVAMNNPPVPISWDRDPKSMTVGNVDDGTLMLGPAERADVIVDFSAVPSGSKLILYNDAPAPWPASDPRLDYFTGNSDQTPVGGTVPTIAGYGPNTRTLMQIQVQGTPAQPFDFTALDTAIPQAYVQSQEPPVVPQTYYPGAYGANSDLYARIFDSSLAFTPPAGGLGQITLDNPGSGYTSAPAVRINGGGGTGAAATATIVSGVNSLTLTNRGTGYSQPTVTFTGGGTGATATATVANVVNTVTVTNGGTGYTTAPTVTFSGANTTSATATATIRPVLSAVTVTNGGTGYTTAPTVTFSGAGGTGATATATITRILNTITITNGGRNYTSAPSVSFIGSLGAGGTPATATATVSAGRIIRVTITNPGSGYIVAPIVRFTGGGGTGAAATATVTGVVNSVTVTNPGTGYTGAPSVVFTSASGTGARATAVMTGVVDTVTLSNGGTGYTTAPTVGFSGGGGTGAAATATITGVVDTLELTNPGYGYTSVPLVTITDANGNAAGATATATITGMVNSITLTNDGTGYTTAPAVQIISVDGNGTGAAATASLTRIIPFRSKAIVEEFELSYGRMNTMLGTEWWTGQLVDFISPIGTGWVINNGGQQTNGFGYIDPPTESVRDGEVQIWKITHNGVDTHAIHFHKFDVQIINRVDWAGVVKPPLPNERGWKDTIKVNPLEDTIVGLRPKAPTLPFIMPESVRPLDPTMPLGSTMGFTNPFPDPLNPAGTTTVNELYNFGNEFVWHCHLLGHEEMDMMRPVIFQAYEHTPGKPLSVTAVRGNGQVTVTFGPPFSSGTRPVTSYAVTSNPGNITATGAASPITVSGLANGTAYTFTVKATSALGTGAASERSNSVIPAGPPGAPTGVTAVAGDTQATVTFTLPASNGGMPITSYAVTSNPGGITAIGTASPITITGLTNGTAYRFTVTATNAVGPGPASALSNSVTPSALPAAPTGVTAVAGDAQATVSFTAPASIGGSPITSYTVTSSPGNITATGDLSPITITGLTNGTAYRFAVAATNAAGTGPASAPSNSVTPRALPGVPANVTATAGNQQATVSFTPPVSNGGSPIIRYNVVASPGGRTAMGITSPITITGLTNGTSYSFTVTATTAFGTGPASAPSNNVIPAAVPGAPTGVNAVAGDTQATISFTPPASNGGSPIISYTVTSSPGNITATAAASPITVTGLNNGTAYRFRVTATNAIGTGPASVFSNSVRPLGGVLPPAAPSNFRVATIGMTSLTLRWTDNSNNETGFEIWRALTATGPWTLVRTTLTNATIYTDTGLSRRTTYFYQARAINAGGASAYAGPTSATTR